MNVGAIRAIRAANEFKATHARYANTIGLTTDTRELPFVTAKAVVVEKIKEVREQGGEELLERAHWRTALFHFTPDGAKTLALDTLLIYDSLPFQQVKQRPVIVTDIAQRVVVMATCPIYFHRADVWRKVGGGVDPVTKAPRGFKMIPVLRNVPVTYAFTLNIDTPTEAGRVTEPGQFTRDTIFAAAGHDLQNTDLIVNVTELSPGKKSRRWGQVTTVQGDPDVVEVFGVSEQSVQGITTPHPPDWVKREYPEQFS